MSDEDISVDLDFYRSQIKEFEQEYRDVMLGLQRTRMEKCLSGRWRRK